VGHSGRGPVGSSDSAVGMIDVTKTADSKLFEFSDFAPFVNFENLGRAVRHMDRIIGGWREKDDSAIGGLVCLAMGMDIADLADEQRKKRVGE